MNLPFHSKPCQPSTLEPPVASEEPSTLESPMSYPGMEDPSVDPNDGDVVMELEETPATESTTLPTEDHTAEANVTEEEGLENITEKDLTDYDSDAPITKVSWLIPSR